LNELFELFTPQKAKVFLWHGRALYLGMGISSTLHQHHALQMGISFDQPFKIRCQREHCYEDYSSFIILPNQPHEIDAKDIPAAFLWLEGESDLARSIIQSYGITQAVQAVPDSLIYRLHAILRAASSDEAECPGVKAAFSAVAGEHGNLDQIQPLIDSRMIAVTELLKQDAATDNNVLIRQMADKVHLSPSRLRHLFQEQIGLSMQRYLLWQRLLNALQSIANGASLTQAAHTAGFADSAHLTRTYRMMFGHTPSEIFKNSRFVQVVLCQS